MRTKAGPEEADLFVRFLGEVLKWNAVTWREGAPGRDGDPRYALLHRVPQYKGAFVYVKPQQRQLLFRLLSDAADPSPRWSLPGRVALTRCKSDSPQRRRWRRRWSWLGWPTTE